MLQLLTFSQTRKLLIMSSSLHIAILSKNANAELLLDCSEESSASCSDLTISTEADDSMSNSMSSLSSSLRRSQRHHRVSFGTVTIRHYKNDEQETAGTGRPAKSGSIPKEQTGDIGQYEQARGREPLPWCCALLASETESKRNLSRLLQRKTKSEHEESRMKRLTDVFKEVLLPSRKRSSSRK